MLIIFPVCDRIKLLPYFLQYYSSIGATQFVCGLYNGEKSLLYNKVSSYKRHFNLQIQTSFTSDPSLWNTHSETHGLNRIREEYSKKYDWYCIADLDEFHYFKGKTLPEMVQEAEQGGYDAMHGVFFDRIAIDGAFPDIKGTLDKTFPLVCDLTKCARLASSKIVMARNHVKIHSGHHKTNAKTWYNAAEVHHFKWSKGVYESITFHYNRYQRQGLRTADGWPRILKLIDGGVDIANPKLRVRPASKLGI
jgi:hypothetical protein